MASVSRPSRVSTMILTILNCKKIKYKLATVQLIFTVLLDKFCYFCVASCPLSTQLDTLQKEELTALQSFDPILEIDCITPDNW